MARPVAEEIAVIYKDIDIFAGWLKRFENPDPVLRTEAAGKGLKLYDEVERDPHVHAVLQQRIMAVVGKEWEIIPVQSAKRAGRPAATSQEKIVADFVSQVLENCNFDQARQELLKAILYGYYVVEVIWRVRDGHIEIEKLIGKHPRRFIFTPDRELRLLTLQNMIEGEALPERKFIVFTYGDSDNPYGRGLGQKLWWPVWFKKNGIKFWLVFLEKFGMPTVLGKYPPGTTPEQQEALMDAIEAIQTDTGIKIPDTMNVEFIEASRSGTVTYEQLCEYMDRQISKAVLGQTLTTEIGDKGSYAASQTHQEVRQELIEAVADLLDACLNETLIKWIVDYNFPGVTAYPKIVTYAAPKPDLKAMSEIHKTLVGVGLPISKQYFYETYGIPAPAEGEEVLGAGEVRVPQGSPSQFAELNFTPEQQAVETLKQSSLENTPGMMADVISPIMDIIASSSDFDEAKAKIMAAYGDMDDEKLTEWLAQAMFVADAWGRLNGGST